MADAKSEATSGNSLKVEQVQTICLLIISAICLGGALYWLRTVMVPFVLALFCVFGLSLITDKLRFLQEYPVLSHDRGKAFDYLVSGWGTENVSGLKKRIARKFRTIRR